MSPADGMPSLVTRTLVLDLRSGRRRLSEADVRNRLENAAYRAPAGATVRVVVDADTPHPIATHDLGLDRVSTWAVESESPRALVEWDRLLDGVRT